MDPSRRFFCSVAHSRPSPTTDDEEQSGETSIVKLAIGINLLGTVRWIWLRVEGVKVATAGVHARSRGSGRARR